MLGPSFVLVFASLSCMLLAAGFIPASHVGVLTLWPILTAIGFVAFYLSVAKLREFFRSVEALQQELQEFRCEDCLCHCCSSGHRARDGSRLLCDRRIIFSCISSWFGSVEDFDSIVRTQVLNCLTTQLSSHVLTYREFVFMAVPILWYQLDSFCAHWDFILRPWPGHPLHLREPVRMHGRIATSLKEVIRGPLWAFGLIPILFFTASKLSCVLRRQVGESKCARMLGDVCINCLINLVVILEFAAMLVLEEVSANMLIGNYIGQLDMLLFTVLVFLLTWLLFRCASISIGAEPQQAQTSLQKEPDPAGALGASSVDHNSSTEETDAPAASWQNSSSRVSKATRLQL